MSFWNLSDDSSAIDTGAEFDGGGGSVEPIPEGTTVLAMPDDAKWAEDRQGNEHLSIRWTVLKPEAYQGRKIFHKLWVSADKPKHKDPVKYRDKQLKMLAAIDTNAGGKLARKTGKPTDNELALALVNKQMTLRLGVWEMDGDNGPMSGNWVQAIGDKGKLVSEGQPRKPATTRPATNIGDFDDDVPF